jgi:hypothetical protein
VKLATFENQQHQDMCENLLGSVKNTSFTIFDSEAKKRLVKPSRSPRMSFGNNAPYSEIEKIAAQAGSKPSDGNTLLQDFHTVKQALVACSADQRLLVLTVSNAGQSKAAKVQVTKVFNDSRVRGVAHFDQVILGSEKWETLIKEKQLNQGHFIVRAEAFGRYATVMKELPLEASSSQLLSSLIKENETFAAVEKRKNFMLHVKAGTAEGVVADTAISRKSVREGKVLK